MGTRAQSAWVCPVGALLAAWTVTPLVVLLFDLAASGGVLTGSDGASAGADQFQYMAWIRDSGLHGLIANNFELTPGHAVFLHPMFLLSGVAWRLGLGLQLAYLLWKPVAIIVLLVGFGAYVSRVERGKARLAVLVLSLFYLSPVLPALDWSGHLHGFSLFDAILGAEELSPAWQLWVYLPAAIAVWGGCRSRWSAASARSRAAAALRRGL